MISSKRISIEAKKIEVVKDWPKLKSVHNIQVFLGFANFYWQFIQGFSRIVAPLTSMLKTIESPDALAPSRNNGSKSAFSRNNNSKPVFRKSDGNGKVNRLSIGRNGVEHTKKLRKLSKSGKKLSKSRNSTNFDTIEAGPKFLTSDARTTFNCLRLAFIEAPILRHFDSEYHIWIEIDASGYAISKILSQLTFGTNSNGIVTKIDLS